MAVKVYDEDAAFMLADDAATLEAVARRVSADRLREARFGEWSGIDVYGHLAHAAEVFAERVRRAIEEDRPTVQSYDQDAVAREQRDDSRDPIALAKRVSEAHRAMIRMLQPAGNRLRAITHSEQGLVTAGHFATYQAEHAHDHALEIAKAFPPS